MNSELSGFAARLRERIRLTAASDPDGSLEEAQFNLLALELFRHQFELNSPYRRLCESREAIPGRISHWTEVPSVPTSAFKDFEFSCLPPRVRTLVFHSSGTTAQKPSRHFHSPESIALYEDSALAWFRGRVMADLALRPGHFAWVMLTPPAEQAPHSSLVHMFEAIRRSIPAPESCFMGETGTDGSWNLNSNSVLSMLDDAVRDGRPVILLGTAFLFVHLLDSIAGRNLRLPAGSRIFETGGYKGRSRTIPKSELRAMFHSLLGVPANDVISEYGMSELSSQAYDVSMRSTEFGDRNVPLVTSREERVFQFPPWARWQVVSPEDGCEVVPGETGLLRVVDLANVFSVMAVQTEDLAVRGDSGFELVGRAEGAEARGCSLMSASAVPSPHSALGTPHLR